MEFQTSLNQKWRNSFLKVYFLIRIYAIVLHHKTHLLENIYNSLKRDHSHKFRVHIFLQSLQSKRNALYTKILKHVDSHVYASLNCIVFFFFFLDEIYPFQVWHGCYFSCCITQRMINSIQRYRVSGFKKTNNVENTINHKEYK